jgi:hypothetical protein
MKRIKSIEELERKRRNNGAMIAIVFVGLLVLSTLGYSLMSNEERSDSSKVSENGYDFYREGDLWRTTIDGVTLRFSYLPSELENISVEGSYDLGSYYNQPLYLVGPSGAYLEVLNVIGGYLLRYQEACAEGFKCEGDFPIKSCDNNIIVFSNDEETKVYNNQSCVYIQGDLTKGADAFLYKLLRIE